MNDEVSEELVVRKDHRKKIIFTEEDSFTYELLTPNSQGDIEFMLMKIPPNEASSKELFCHKGEEVAYVIKGSVRLVLMNSSIELNCGDSLRILPFSKHKWENNGVEECEVIFAVTPPSF